MRLYKNTKVKVRSPDGDTDNFVAGELQGDTLSSYLFIICLDYVLKERWMAKIMVSSWQKKGENTYPAQTITNANYAGNIALLVNSPAQAETLVHSLEWEPAGIGVHVNAYKMKYMCCNQSSSLKLVDKFTYHRSSVSSNETDINTRLEKTWTTIGHMEVRPDR